MKIHFLPSLFAVVFATFSSPVWSEKIIFKCKNEKGDLVYQKSACGANAETLDSWSPKEQPVEAEAESDTQTDEQNSPKKKEPVVLTLQQNISGHYKATGSINNKPLNFVVDTGATLVSLPELIAHEASIYCDEKIKVDTANGAVDSCTAKINELKFGPFIIKDVTAVLQSNLEQPLLGMNVLQLFKIEQNSGEMKLTVLENAKSNNNENSPP